MTIITFVAGGGVGYVTARLLDVTDHKHSSRSRSHAGATLACGCTAAIVGMTGQHEGHCLERSSHP